MAEAGGYRETLYINSEHVMSCDYSNETMQTVVTGGDTISLSSTSSEVGAHIGGFVVST